MALLTFSQDDRPAAVDEPLERIADGASVLNKPIKLRIAPWLYDWRRVNYTSWAGLAWTLELEDVAEGRRLRQGLTAFFAAFAASPGKQRKLVQQLKAWVDEE